MILQKYDTTNLCTPLYRDLANLDFANIVAKMVARKTGLPVYVGNSLSFSSTALGGVVEEQMAVFKKIMEVMLDKLKPHDKSSAPAVTNNMSQLGI
jgi:hypothetical protein